MRRYFRQEGGDGQAQVLLTSADSNLVDALFFEAKSNAFDLNRASAQIVRLGS